jgi:hypothetical protein
VLSPSRLRGRFARLENGRISTKDGVHRKMQAYHSLEERFARLSSIEDAIGILQ